MQNSTLVPRLVVVLGGCRFDAEVTQTTGFEQARGTFLPLSSGERWAGGGGAVTSSVVPQRANTTGCSLVCRLWTFPRCGVKVSLRQALCKCSLFHHAGRFRPLSSAITKLRLANHTRVYSPVGGGGHVFCQRKPSEHAVILSDKSPEISLPVPTYSCID